MKYIFFWIPTINPISDFVLLGEKVRDNISDLDPPVDVEISVIKSRDLHITVTYSDSDEDESVLFLSLYYKDESGMCVYKCTCDYELLIEEAFRKCIYHLFKQLYHRHHFHDEKEDSLLSAYIVDRQDLTEDDLKEARESYCKVYQEKFKAYSEEINDDLNYIIEKQSKLGFLQPCVEGLYGVSNTVIKALGELIYYEYIVSLNTDDCNAIERISRMRHDLSVKKQKIENNSQKLQFKISQAQANLAVTLAIIGIIIGAICFIQPLMLNTVAEKQQNMENRMAAPVESDDFESKKDSV